MVLSWKSRQESNNYTIFVFSIYQLVRNTFIHIAPSLFGKVSYLLKFSGDMFVAYLKQRKTNFGIFHYTRCCSHMAWLFKFNLLVACFIRNLFLIYENMMIKTYSRHGGYGWEGAFNGGGLITKNLWDTFKPENTHGQK